MKKFLISSIIFPILILTANACASPQVTATVTLPPPTVTAIPTPTLNPQFVILQTQIAAAGADFTLLRDGTIEEMTEGGAKTVTGLSVSKNGQINLLVNGEVVVLTSADASFDDNDGAKIKGYEFDKKTGTWLLAPEPLTPAQLADMTPEQKLDSAPEGTDGYTKSNISTVKDNLVIYRDGQGQATQVYDLLTGETLTLPEAGIKEFDLTDGGKYEMRSFATAEEALAYVAQESLWYIDKEAERQAIDRSWFNTSKAYSFVIPLKKIPGHKPKRGFSLPRIGSNFYQIIVDKNGNGTDIILQDSEKDFEAIYLEMETIAFITELDRDGYTIPTPQP